MKYFAQFKHYDSNQELTDALGSDSVFKLDGRKTLENKVNDAYERLNVLSNTHPTWKYFEIRKGDLKRSHIIYKNYYDEP